MISKTIHQSDSHIYTSTIKRKVCRIIEPLTHTNHIYDDDDDDDIEYMDGLSMPWQYCLSKKYIYLCQSIMCVWCVCRTKWRMMRRPMMPPPH